jgi:DNA repair protein RecN (Recombination protein N)
MLSHISIQNYALIDFLEIDFSKGLTVITGETGAGKSILLGALDLIVGSRADTNVLMNNNVKCIVEGTFHVGSYSLEIFFEKFDLDYEDITILRREINTNGKSRAFINDTPVNLSVLKELGQKLVDIHSQHQNLSLTSSAFQFTVLDSMAGILDEVKQYRLDFTEFKRKKKELTELLETEKQSNAEKDYFEFVVNEMDEARLLAGEQEQIEQELEILEHAEEIKSVLFSASGDLGNEETGLVNRLQQIRANLQKIASYSGSLQSVSDRLQSCLIEMTDILFEIQKIEEDISFNPERSENIKERLDLLYGLQTKHRVKSVDELLQLSQEINLKLSTIQSLENRITSLKSEIEQWAIKINKQAGSISSKRMTVFTKLADEIEASLKQLGMPHANFRVHHSVLNEAGADGLDAVQFMFNANRGGELQELSVVASGGEKSRLMLAIKSLVSKNILLPTIIFDEIDTGVSGPVADKVGNILLKLSASMQVLAISHLPQIAGKGKDHFLVYKENSESETKTKMKKLNPDERIFEIAKLLSGQEVTSASVESAKLLLKN